MKTKSQSLQLQPYILSLLQFMISNGYVEKPIPPIRLIRQQQSNNPIEVRTGHYDPIENEICLFIAGRHPKDILRTLAHELIHVQQDHEGRLTGFDADSSLKDDKTLREIEGEAFLKGNLALRDWTEKYTHKNDNVNESTKITLTIAQIKKLIKESTGD